MTSQGSSYQRLLRACATGNPVLVRATAAELPRLSLADALRVTLGLARADRATFPRAAARWLGRLALETGVTVSDLQVAGAALILLPDRPELARELFTTVGEDLAIDGLVEALDHGAKSP